MKTFVSIGAGPGMGMATAERFAKEGFRIVLASRASGKSQQLADELKSKGCTAEAKAVEAGDMASVASLIDSVQKQYGTIEVIHYNAASMRQATILNQPRETFVPDLAVNIGGALAAIQAVAPGMIKQGSGSILLTGGGFALEPSPDFISLSIGKAGIRALAQGLFEDFKSIGIHVATVTVAANVTPSSTHATAIAAHFWALHNQALGF
jgi:NADP-dependent 3-hydroxy acid dehydrogenase YdfG